VADVAHPLGHLLALVVNPFIAAAVGAVRAMSLAAPAAASLLTVLAYLGGAHILAAQELPHVASVAAALFYALPQQLRFDTAAVRAAFRSLLVHPFDYASAAAALTWLPSVKDITRTSRTAFGRDRAYEVDRQRAVAALVALSSARPLLVLASDPVLVPAAPRGDVYAPAALVALLPAFVAAPGQLRATYVPAAAAAVASGLSIPPPPIAVGLVADARPAPGASAAPRAARPPDVEGRAAGAGGRGGARAVAPPGDVPGPRRGGGPNSGRGGRRAPEHRRGSDLPPAARPPPGAGPYQPYGSGGCP